MLRTKRVKTTIRLFAIGAVVAAGAALLPRQTLRAGDDGGASCGYAYDKLCVTRDNYEYEDKYCKNPGLPSNPVCATCCYEELHVCYAFDIWVYDAYDCSDGGEN